MSKEELFHRQLINSYVAHVAKTPFEEFMVRSELTRRTREYLGGMGSHSQEYQRATTSIFFAGDKNAYTDHLEQVGGDLATIYKLETAAYGMTTIVRIAI